MRAKILSAAVIALATGAVYVRGHVSPPAVERVAPRRPSLHPAPPEDLVAANAVADRRLPESLRRIVLPDERASVVLFLKADCGCSEGFARHLTAVEPYLRARAACLAVIDTSTADSRTFLAETGLSVRHLDQADGALAAAWGVTKAGCMALVRPDGGVETIWPGVSRQGFCDLAERLGVGDAIPPETLADFPGTAIAGCPLNAAASPPSTGAIP